MHAAMVHHTCNQADRLHNQHAAVLHVAGSTVTTLRARYKDARCSDNLDVTTKKPMNGFCCAVKALFITAMMLECFSAVVVLKGDLRVRSLQNQGAAEWR